MVTDSILSVIIFKWAVINDVSAVRVLQAPGWMTSALKLPFFKLCLSHTRTHTQSQTLPLNVGFFVSCRAHARTHARDWRELGEPGNKSPGAKHNIDHRNPFFIDFTISVAA